MFIYNYQLKTLVDDEIDNIFSLFSLKIIENLPFVNSHLNS